MFSHRPVYLNSWSPVSATVWEGCGTLGTLLGEVHHWDQTLSVYSFAPLPILSHCFVGVDVNVTCHLPTPSTMPSLPWWTLIPLESQTQINLFVPKLLVSGYYNTATEKLLIHPSSSQILIDYPITLFGSFFPWSSRSAHKKGRQSKCTIILCYSDTRLSKDADPSFMHLYTQVTGDLNFWESKSNLRDALRIFNHKEPSDHQETQLPGCNRSCLGCPHII